MTRTNVIEELLEFDNVIEDWSFSAVNSSGYQDLQHHQMELIDQVASLYTIYEND